MSKNEYNRPTEPPSYGNSAAEFDAGYQGNTHGGYVQPPPQGYQNSGQQNAGQQTRGYGAPPQGYQQYQQYPPQQYQQGYQQYPPQQYPQYQQQPVYVQQPRRDNSNDCLMGCLAAMCVCCALDAIF